MLKTLSKVNSGCEVWSIRAMLMPPHISCGHDAVARARKTDRGLFDPEIRPFIFYAIHLIRGDLHRSPRVQPRCGRGYYYPYPTPRLLQEGNRQRLPYLRYMYYITILLLLCYVSIQMYS